MHEMGFRPGPLTAYFRVVLISLGFLKQRLKQCLEWAFEEKFLLFERKCLLQNYRVSIC